MSTPAQHTPEEFEELQNKILELEQEKDEAWGMYAQAEATLKNLEAKRDQEPHDEPLSGSMASFVAQQAELVRNQQQFLKHQTMQHHQVPQFTGQGEPFVDEWVERVKYLQSARQWDDADMYNDVRLAISEPAYSSVINAADKTDTLPKLLAFLKAEYGHRNAFVHWLRTMSKGMQQKENESAEDYNGRFTTARRRLEAVAPQPYEDREYRAWYIDGLREPYKTKIDDMNLAQKLPLGQCMKAARSLDRKFASSSSYSLAVNAVLLHSAGFSDRPG